MDPSFRPPKPSRPVPSYVPPKPAGGPVPTPKPAPVPVAPAPQPVFNPTPAQPEDKTAAPKPAPTKKSKKKLLLVIFALALIVATVGSMAAWQLHKQPAAKTPTTVPVSTVKDTQQPVNGKLVLSPTVVPQATTKTQLIKGSMNQQLNMSDGFSFMATKAVPYVSTDTTNVPEAGKEFYAVTIVGGNRSSTGSIVFSDTFFQVRDSEGKLINSNFASDQIPNNSFSTLVTLKTGQQQTGVAIFEVAPDKTPLTLVYKKQYQVDKTKSIYTVEGDVKVR